MGKRSRFEREHRRAVRASRKAEAHFFDRGPALWEDELLDRSRAPSDLWSTAKVVSRLDWASITDQLATGGMPRTTAEVTELVNAGVTLVINCADDFISPPAMYDHRVRYLGVPTPDDGRRKPISWFEAILDEALPAIARGEKIYVHCLEGSNRGPSAAYAILRRLGRSPEEAFRLVRAARPRASLIYVRDADVAVDAYIGSLT